MIPGLRDTGRHSGNPARETKTYSDNWPAEARLADAIESALASYHPDAFSREDVLEILRDLRDDR